MWKLLSFVDIINIMEVKDKYFSEKWQEMTFLKKCEFYDKLQQLCYTKTK